MPLRSEAADHNIFCLIDFCARISTGALAVIEIISCPKHAMKISAAIQHCTKPTRQSIGSNCCKLRFQPFADLGVEALYVSGKQQVLLARKSPLARTCHCRACFNVMHIDPEQHFCSPGVNSSFQSDSFAPALLKIFATLSQTLCLAFRSNLVFQIDHHGSVQTTRNQSFHRWRAIPAVRFKANPSFSPEEVNANATRVCRSINVDFASKYENQVSQRCSRCRVDRH